MIRTPVLSANLRSVGYDDQYALLEIEFNSGRIYAYKDVPHEEYAKLMNSLSKNDYFQQHIKNRYACYKVF